MTDRAEEIRSLLRRREATGIAHPGGTLAGHLERVRERLARDGAREDLQLAGLGHAVYGTDGFDVPLVSTAHREAIRDMLGPEVELIIYRYGATDRSRTWPALVTGQLWDRFESSVETLDPGDPKGLAQLRDQADLSIVKELDVLEHAGQPAARQRAQLAELITAWQPITSPAVAEDARQALGRLSG
jgi:hypothetical protein